MSTVSSSASSSRLSSTLHTPESHHSLLVNDDSMHAPPSPAPSSSFKSSSSGSDFNPTKDDEENITVTAKRLPPIPPSGSRQSIDDLQLLAISTNITELSYSISDIQTRIFEIQELRHKSQSSNDLSASTSVIDQSLMALDERLESVANGVKAVTASIQPLLNNSPSPPTTNGSTGRDSSADDEKALLVRKHAAFIADWESVQEESDVLREELKEDKWLTVFRTVTEQADGMMTSLEKAVNRCQEFVFQFQRHGGDEGVSSSQSQPMVGTTRSEGSPMNIDVFNQLSDSFEAKKKHYMPATTKVLSIIDKGVQDRVTKNGECLRRHAESTQRWKVLRDRISRTDAEMESVRQLLTTEITPSESGSTTSGPTTATTATSKTKNGLLTPPNGSSSVKKRMSTANALSRSMSPFRTFAKKFSSNNNTTTTNTPKSIAVTPEVQPRRREPSSEPNVRHRQSIFAFRTSQPTTPITPERPGHKHAQSLTPEASPSSSHRTTDANLTVKGRPSTSSTTPSKQPWNSSTKVQLPDPLPADRLARRRTSSTNLASRFQGGDVPPVPTNSASYQRSVSRSSMGSSRPWSPVTSSVSTAPSSTPFQRPPSRTQQTPSSSRVYQRPPSRSNTPSAAATVAARSTRPRTPSNIPSPAGHHRTMTGTALSDASWDDDVENQTSLMQRAFSPALSASSSARSGAPPRSPPRSQTPGGTRLPGPRPPSRSMIPAPVFHFSSPSRPGSAMSEYMDHSPGHSSMSNSSAFRNSAMRAQTPENLLRSRAAQVPFVTGLPTTPGGSPAYNTRTIRGVGAGGMISNAPSSFRNTESSSSRAPSRSGSRAGSYTPMQDMAPLHIYTPGSMKDPLDTEVASIVNSVAHGLLVERVDPPLRKAPKEGEEIMAQYAFSNNLGRKVVTARLTTLSRVQGKGMGPVTNKKVMVRVGGGWQDLQLYMLNRQAGM